MRVIDLSKRSNIKCEHCAHFMAVQICGGLFGPPKWRCMNPLSPHKGEERNYYNRCKEFAWTTKEASK